MKIERDRIQFSCVRFVSFVHFVSLASFLFDEKNNNIIRVLSVLLLLSSLSSLSSSSSLVPLFMDDIVRQSPNSYTAINVIHFINAMMCMVCCIYIFI